MAQPSESQSQPPPVASPNKIHSQDDKKGLLPSPTDDTHATSNGGTSSSSRSSSGNPYNTTTSNTTTTTTTTTNTTPTPGTSSATFSTTATTTTTTPTYPSTANPDTNGGESTSEHLSSETTTTNLAVGPGITPHAAALPDNSSFLSRNGENGAHNATETTSPSPSMSNAHHQQGPHRQQVGYPSPTSFPSPGMPPTAQYAYPPQQGQHVDPYRASPTAVNTSMALPSMRTIDPHQSQQQAHNMAMGAAAMGAPMPTPGAPIYYNMPPHHPYAMHSADPNALRYPLPPNVADPRIAMSGGRHKKEIKRRTKTGCLTCRKRRIKCDETHPTCNNCKKSKRECMGYDPIFKQQPGPAAIQPAPNSQGASPTTLVSPPTIPSSTTHPFQPPVVPSSYPPAAHPNSAFEQPLQPSAKLGKTEGGFEYPPAIDPSLGGVGAPVTGNPAQYQTAQKPAGDQKLGIHSTGPRGGTPLPIDPLHAPSPSSSQPRLPQEITLTYMRVPAKMVKVDELVALGGAPPPDPTTPPTPETVEEITRLYYEVYVPGLTAFFESGWYDLNKDQPPTATNNSLSVLKENPRVMNLFTTFLHTISKVKTTNPADMMHSGHLESCLVWALARLPLPSLPTSVREPPAPYPAQDDVIELCNRIIVFETLLSGEYLQTNPLTPSPELPRAPSKAKDFNYARANELDFWYHLGEYVLRSNNPTGATGRDGVVVREAILSRMRAVLDSRENRDVLYSIVVLRELAPLYNPTLNEQNVPIHLDEVDPRNKLAVATRFIRDEAASTGGTTNVVRRFADVAYRAFVQPAVNVETEVRFAQWEPAPQ